VLLLSAPLVLQYEAVLTRPEHLAAAGMTTAEDRKPSGCALCRLHARRGFVFVAAYAGAIRMTKWCWRSR